MKLPNATELIVERGKILDYLLNPVHRYGAAKERFFTAFGFRADAWELLAEALREHGRKNGMVRAYETGFGPRFIVEGVLNTPTGRRPRVRTVWQLKLVRCPRSLAPTSSLYLLCRSSQSLHSTTG